MLPTGAQLALLAIVLGAYFVGTVLGFGTTILTVTFGAQLVDMDILLPIVAPLNVGLATYLAVRHRRATDWRLLLRQVWPLVAVGVPIGLALFNLRRVGWLRLGFGVLVTVLAAVQLRAAAHEAPPAALGTVRRSGLLLLGGIIHGLYATAGPLIVYVIGRQLRDKSAFRSTLSTMFIPLTTALMVDYALTGLFTATVARMTLWAVAPMLAGLWLGELAHHRIGQHTFTKSVWRLLLFGGLLLVMRASLTLWEGVGGR